MSSKNEVTTQSNEAYDALNLNVPTTHNPSYEEVKKFSHVYETIHFVYQTNN